ncbi:hypothetical protein [Streptomyces nanshensis]|uniref:Uncharacterized protein n=1 Tax=Streptomyces nanshensis TaxID=518642 RepID=A0A1E7L9Z5_9ACTN|nr:hypothetical protein [Streptomyces nanshensis]OEV13016.1 hypothetical protein AN218_05785 [Streptomyces nanshensis]
MSNWERADPAMYLAGTARQVTAPHYGATQPLPPTRSLAGWLRENAARLAPGLVASAACGLARLWHEQLPQGSTEPLWIMGALTALTASGGTVAAAQPNGDRGIVGAAYAAAAVAAMTGVAAYTPRWPLAVLLCLLSIAGAYGLCAPHWHAERRAQLHHERELETQRLRGEQSLAHTALQLRGEAEVEKWRARREEAVVDQITRASDARTARILAPGDELNVAALLRAAGHNAPQELPAGGREAQNS